MGTEKQVRGSATTLLNTAKEPKFSSGLVSRGFAQVDLALMQRLLIADATFHRAASYYMATGLDVSDEDVLEYDRRYNPKLLGLSSQQRSNSIFVYLIRCVKLSHLEDISDTQFSMSFVMQFNNTLMEAALEMEQNVEKLMPAS